MEWGAGILLGIGLSAAVGFRVFVPILIMSIASRFGFMELSHGFEWIGSTPAMIILVVATTLEIMAYFIPWFDNIMDSITTPLAVVAGTLVMAGSIIEMEPWIKWTLAIIAGGGTAGLIQGTTSAARITSSATTAGFANPLVSTMELGFSSILSIIAIFIPVLVLLFLFFFIFIIRKIYKSRKNRV